MKYTLKSVVLTIAALMHVSTWAQTTSASPPVNDAVYQAFGQKAGIEALMEDFFVRLQADPRTGPFFKSANRTRLVFQLTEQLCYESGGPCTYKGAPMRTAHAGMNIGKEDFNALVEVLQASMDSKGIPFAAQNAMLARLAPMHRDIITKN